MRPEEIGNIAIIFVRHRGRGRCGPLRGIIGLEDQFHLTPDARGDHTIDDDRSRALGFRMALVSRSGIAAQPIKDGVPGRRRPIGALGVALDIRHVEAIGPQIGAACSQDP